MFIAPQKYDVRAYIKHYEAQVAARNEALEKANKLVQTLEKEQDYLAAMQEYEKVGDYWYKLYEIEKINTVYKAHYLKKAMSYYQLAGELSLKLPQGLTDLDDHFKDLFVECAESCHTRDLSDLRISFARYAAHATAKINTTSYPQPLLKPHYQSKKDNPDITSSSSVTFDGLRRRRRLKTTMEAATEEEERLLKQTESADHKAYVLQ